LVLGLTTSETVVVPVTVRIPVRGVFDIELVVLFGSRSQIAHPGGRGINEDVVAAPSEYSSVTLSVPEIAASLV
jgi:hypothetical protein